MAIEARFDDLSRPGAPSFRLVGPVGVVEARRPEEVAGVLEAAEAAARRGLWAAGFVAYEAAPGLDPGLAVRPRPTGGPFADLPLAWFALFEGREPVELPEPASPPAPPAPGAWRPEVDDRRYRARVEAIRSLIAAGEVYQVNLTLRLRSRFAGDPRGLYRDLCLAQRGAHNCYLASGRYHVCSASPELFFARRGDRVVVRPMKGTAPRGRWAEEDRAARERLRASPKDRAENAMIVDLLRNDLGRVARPGTVRWPRLFDAERYETVWQLTSTVEAELRPGVGLVDLFRALFPSGSVTGAPKVRAMRAIADLEASPRGVYTGAVGYLAPGEPRAARFAVAIRTAVVDEEAGIAEYGTGGGITYDSDPEAERREATAKAAVLAIRRPSFELLETVRAEPGGLIPFLEDHLDRLEASASYFGFVFDRARAAALLSEAARGAEVPLRLRLTLARSGALDLGAEPVPDPSPTPVRLALDGPSVDPADPLWFHKTTARDRYAEAAARHPDADDVLLVNLRGEVTESTIANLAVRTGGRWWTPPLGSGLLPGVFRGRLLRAGRLRERPIRAEELPAAEALALLNAVRLWRPAVLLP
ncbi:MAG TPA: bifunctional anthranilate synthase component I family protein/class IV aminotransferase [Actinomycetota bacterium]|nr:bifunctional anthranilate synthase component I family protein/class IV aminotransferase [Actinomycetota bacterium]